MAKAVPKLRLSSGHDIPTLGLGTWRSDPKELVQAVKDAIDIGYRHFDCAFIYENEAEVGQGLHEKLIEGSVSRGDLFITSKVWNTFHSTERTVECVKKSLANLQTPYLDLCLIHWPMGYHEGGALFPKNDNDEFEFSDVDYLDTWKGLEKCVDEGLVRSIGLSNFNSEQIQRVSDNAKIKPAVLQVECHPYLNQEQLLEFCKKNDIILTAYSCLGSPARPVQEKDDPIVMEDPVIKDIAEKVKKTPAQVCLRYQIQRGIVVIPKSVNKKRLESNFNVFDFELTDDQMQAINGIDKKIRLVSLTWVKHHPYYPFSIPY